MNTAVAPAMWMPTSSGGTSLKYCDVPHARLREQHDEQHRHPRLHRVRCAVAAHSHSMPSTSTRKMNTMTPWMRAGVGDRESSRRTSSLLPATAVRAGTGDDGAGEQGPPTRRRATPGRARRFAGSRSACDGPSGCPTRAEDDRVGEQHDRHEEVRHHERRREVEEHGQPAEHRLREHARHQAEREPLRSRRRGVRTRLPAPRRSPRSTPAR